MICHSHCFIKWNAQGKRNYLELESTVGLLSEKKLAGLDLQTEWYLTASPYAGVNLYGRPSGNRITLNKKKPCLHAMSTALEVPPG